MAEGFKNKIFIQYGSLAVLIAFLILCYQSFDFDFVQQLILNSQEGIEGKKLYIAFIIFFLRAFSIVIPIIPGTYCAIISGYVFGIKSGLLLMFVADFLSCASSFFISRKLGRSFVRKLLGSKQMSKIEKISQNYLEQNFFLMTGFLMTSWFDFVCYAVGLTKLSWKKFLPALVLSIIISDLPFVAGGNTIKGLQGVSLSEVLNGEVSVLKGPYLLILIFSALLIFGLGIFNSFIKKGNRII